MYVYTKLLLEVKKTFKVSTFHNLMENNIFVETKPFGIISLRSFCEYYDMQEHSSRIFSDIIDAVGGFIQSYLTTTPAAPVQLPLSSSGGAINSNTGHVTSLPTLSGRHVHMFTIKGITIQVEALPPNSHSKPAL